MPNSYRIRTDIGTNKVLQVNLDQDFDKLEILSMSIFPNDVYTRSCADFGVICGRVFANRGLGLVNARVSVFIPISEEDELNPIISTLYPYKSFEDFNEDGYKYNLLPYSQSYSGHVPVGTFPDRLDALVNPSVVEVYDKYYKFTAKTNDAGDFMIFGVPVGQYELFMQVDLSDIGEFSLTPQDLIRMGRAVESQVNGTRFKFSENYSELPQIVTLTKTIQVAPFYGEEGVCQHYIVRADFDLTTESSIELKPTAVFIGSLISTDNRVKLKDNCKVPRKLGNLCALTAGPGQIECIRQTIFTDDDGRPILEEHRLENDGKLIDENGAWLVELPMNLDYQYTDEFGQRRISYDGSAGVPTRSRYRFKIKWQQSTSVNEENKRGYFLVPNIKEYGWTNTNLPGQDPVYIDNDFQDLILPALVSPPEVIIQESTDVNVTSYWRIIRFDNVSSYEVLVDGVVRPEFQTLIPLAELMGSEVIIRYVITDNAAGNGTLYYDNIGTRRFGLQSSYAFSLSWYEYGTSQMIQEAIDCEDRFYEFIFNKVYTVSQFLDRFSIQQSPEKTLQIKNILDNSCESENYPFPTNDVIYRTDVLFTIVNIFLTVFKFILVGLVPIIHMLAFLWIPLAIIIAVFLVVYNIVVAICNFVSGIGFNFNCPPAFDIEVLFEDNPFKNIRLPLVLYTEDGCETCRCNTGGVGLEGSLQGQLAAFAQELTQTNISPFADLNLDEFYTGVSGENLTMLTGTLTADYPWRNKLPIIGVGTTSGAYHRWSQDLTLGEKLNLFNTKAKYFDKMSAPFTAPPETNAALGLNNPAYRLSPGDKGWNQIKVTWKPNLNDINTKFHFDNIIVVIFDSTVDINDGDLLTFQAPERSNDPNVNTTMGINALPNNITVKYANPDYRVGGFLQTSYTIIGPDEEQKSGDSINCYPSDIEYFQVIDVKTGGEFFNIMYNSGGAWFDVLNGQQYSYGLNVTSDNKYSFPHRFFTVNDYNTFLNTNTGPTSFSNTNRVYYNNIGTGGNIANPVNCSTLRASACGHAIPHMVADLSPALDSPQLQQQSGSKIVFLQRGVDPNSPKIDMRIDMSRIYGADYNTWANLYPSYWNDETVSRFWIKRGNYRMNIPIQAGGDDTGAGENWTSINPSGLFLPRHNEITNNDSNFSTTWSNVHFKSYVYTYNAGEWIGDWTSDSLKYYSALDGNTKLNYQWYDDTAGVSVYSPGYVDAGLTNSNIVPSAFDIVAGPFNGLTVAAINCEDNKWRGTSGKFNEQQDNYFASSFVTSTGNDGWVLIRATCENPGLFNQDCSRPDGPSCGYSAGGLYGCGIYHHVPLFNSRIGHVSGYFDKEYVEGGSAFLITGNIYNNVAAGNSGVHVNLNNCEDRQNFTEIYSSTESTNSCTDQARNNYRIFPESAHYISPTYATMVNIIPGTYTRECICTYSSVTNIVIRTDRLPSSDTPETNSAGNGYLLNQNAGFSVYKITGDCVTEFLGGGEINLPVVSNEDISSENLPSQFQTVANSLSNCENAVDLNSYGVDDNPNSPDYGTPFIYQENPYSIVSANTGSDYIFFQRGVGCYNLISKPILSLIGTDIDGDPYERRYSDIRIIVEWVQRLKLNFALCFNVFSHTFSNNWINGTLFAFPFKNTTYFDSNNQPYRIYCQRNIYFNEVLKSYFYRSSPYDGSNDLFVGRPSSNVNDTPRPRGNVKNLLYPTTIMDLGPKNQFIQELVFNDDYDGYIVDKIPSTTFKDVTDVLNLFVLSRVINVTFINFLIPTTLFTGGNEGGSDPSIGAFFANLRWNNGERYRNYLLPGLIDADYAQTIAVQSQYGVYEFSTETYGAEGIFFGRYDLTTEYVDPETSAFVVETIPNAGPLFGLFFSANTQNMDYISPRRTIFNNDAVTPPDYLNDFLQIPTFSQVIPYYRWEMFYTNSNTIFGYQSNNNVTENLNDSFPTSRYQQFDRAATASQYFAPDGNLNGNLIRNYLSYPINFVSSVDANGNTIYTPTQALPATTVNPITLGTPFYFYFGLKQGASAMDRFITKYVDTTIINE
jgi:hypothetical protein